MKRIIEDEESGDNYKLQIKVKLTRLPASRSSSVGPEGRFLFFHPKVKVKERMSLGFPSSLKKTFLLFEKAGGKGAYMPFDRNGNGSDLKPF